MRPLKKGKISRAFTYRLMAIYKKDLTEELDRLLKEYDINKNDSSIKVEMEIDN